MISQEGNATHIPIKEPIDLLPYSRILVLLDGSALAEEALPVAIALAQHAETPGEVILLPLHLTECIISSRAGPVAVPAVVPEEIDTYVARLERDMKAQGVSVEMARTAGDVASGIAELVRIHQVDLLIMVTHASQDMSRIIPGSIAERLLKAAAIPLLLLKQGEGATLLMVDIPRLVLRP